MELRHLNYFIAVADELHFGKAAKRLNISQPPLSRQIKQLEEEIGVRLFNRTRRKVEITAAGRVFLEEARRIVALSREAVRRTVLADKGEIGRLAVGFIGSANYSILPQVIREFCRQEAGPGGKVERVGRRRQPRQSRAGPSGGDVMDPGDILKDAMRRIE